MYDGLSGIVTKSYYGARTEGGAGMLKGLGKGIAGIMTKPGAGTYLRHRPTTYQLSLNMFRMNAIT